MKAKDYLSGVYLDNHKFSKEDTIKLMEDYYNYRVEYEQQMQLKNLNIPVVINSVSFKDKLEALAKECGWKLAKYDRL